MMKDSLETQKQTNFNAVFNKIKKDKDAQIRDMAAKISTLEKELQQAKNRTTALNNEISVHKEAYSTMQSDFEKARDDSNTLRGDLTQSKDECITLQTDLEGSKVSIKDLEDQILKLREQQTRSEEDFDRRVNKLDEEKLRVIQELKVQYDQELAREKASLVSAVFSTAGMLCLWDLTSSWRSEWVPGNDVHHCQFIIVVIIFHFFESFFSFFYLVQVMQGEAASVAEDLVVVLVSKLRWLILALRKNTNL